MTRQDRLFPIVLLGVVAIAFLLRFQTVSESLWLDELHTSWAVSGHLSDVATRAAQGNQAPLFYWCAWGMTAAFGHSEIVLRSLSLLPGCLVVAGLMLLVHQWTTSPWLAMLVGLHAAVDVHFIFFARDARPYALIQLLAVLHLALTDRFFRSVDTQPARRVSLDWRWLGVTWLMFYTHYTSLLLLPAEFLACQLAISNAQRRTLSTAWFVNVAVFLVGCCPALPHLAFVFERRDNWRAFIDVKPLSHVWTILPANRYLTVPLAIAVIGWLWQRFQPSVTSRPNDVDCESVKVSDRWWRTALLVSGFIVPTLLAWLATFRTERFSGVAPLFFRRYIIVASVPLVALSGWLGVTLDNRRRRAAFCGIVAVATSLQLIRMSATQWTVHSPENWPAALEIIDRSDETAGWPILLRAGLIEDDALGADATERLREYCEFPLRGMYQSSRPHRPLVSLPSRRQPKVSDLTDVAMQHLTSTRGLWILSRGSNIKAERFLRHVEALLEFAGKEIESRTDDRVDGLSIVRIHLRPLKTEAD